MHGIVSRILERRLDNRSVQRWLHRMRLFKQCSEAFSAEPRPTSDGSDRDCLRCDFERRNDQAPRHASPIRIPHVLSKVSNNRELACERHVL